MNKAIIFDLDGTLLDTILDIMDNVNYMLEHFGYPLVDRERTREIIGSGARYLIKEAINQPVSEVELDERLNYYNTFYTASESPKTKVFDGIGEVLVELKSRGYKLAILTNKPQSTTDRVYNKYLKDYNFDIVIGQRDGVKCKPDKTATINLLKDLDVEPKNCYFVGDGETDAETSINAGTNGISVLWGYRRQSDLEKVGANVFAKTPKDLLKLIK